MRAVAVLLGSILLLPAAGALVLPNPAAIKAPNMLDDISDGDLIALLAAYKGYQVPRLAPPQIPVGLTLSEMATHLALRSGNSLSQEDASVFDAVDPAVATPTLQLLVAIDLAWTMRDEAFAGATLDDMRLARAAMRAGEPGPNVFVPGGGIELLVSAAIMLTDTAENIVIPQLLAVADLPVWPETAIADPVGVLRIGGTGNDLETLHRILQIDPRGDDTYRNNAGGTTILEAGLLQTPVAVSIDLTGDDYYWNRDSNPTPAQGGGIFGIGLFFDMAGDDRYECRDVCMGGGGQGIGLFRDPEGNDSHSYAGNGLGYANVLLGVYRDDSGSDYYLATGHSGGYGNNNGIGLFWDRAGQDEFWTIIAPDAWGDASQGGHGWFLNEGPEIETYRDFWTGLPHPVGCNDCTWTRGDQDRGLGFDNSGDLGTLIDHVF